MAVSLLASAYVVGILAILGGDSSPAAQEPARFWWAIAFWPIVGIPGWINAALNRV